MTQPPDHWPAETGAIIHEMKRRAGVRTDTELAKVLGTSQSNVSTWRKRGVPERVLLGFNAMVGEAAGLSTARFVAARIIAMRVAEHWYARAHASGSTASRWIFYSGVALGQSGIVRRIEGDLAEREKPSGRWAMEIAAELIEDLPYLDALSDWIATSSIETLAV